MKRSLKLLDSSLSTFQSGPGFPSVFIPLLWSSPHSPQSSESLRGVYKNLAGDLVHSSLRE